MPYATEKAAKFKEFSAHFPTTFSKEMREYVTNVVLLNSRYLFIKRMKGIQFAYCTHCKKQWLTEKDLKHNDKAKCAKCDSECVVKASGLGRKYMQDEEYILYYEKSAINPNAMIARGMYVTRDYKDDYTKVETSFRTRAMYLFEMGNSQMYSTWGASYYSEENSVRGRAGGLYTDYVCYESIKESVKGTQFQYSTWEYYTKEQDMLKFFALYGKYPCVEYLTKLGMRYFVDAKLNGLKTYGAINWNGKRIDQVLRLTKQELKVVRDHEGELHPLTLRLQQIIRKDGSSLSLQELQTIATEFGDKFDDLKKVLPWTTLRRSVSYIRKQWEKRKKKDKFARLADTLITWRDYIADCKKLEIDLTNEKKLFRADIFKSHQTTSKQVQAKASKILNERILKHAYTLEKYCFEYEGFFLRPAMSATELIEEGKALNICIGGSYVDTYAEGKTNLFFIRKVDEPEKPFYSMEVKAGVIKQTQGKSHMSPTKEVQQFVNMFKLEKLDKKKSTKKTAKIA